MKEETLKKELIQVEQISDLQSIPQNVSIYSKGIDKGKIATQSSYEKKYFRAWNLQKTSIDIEDAKWAYKIFTPKNSYGENLQLHNQKFFDKILENSNFDNYSSVNINAVTLDLVNLRAFPTIRPVLRDPKRAGEGFPFDYMQNSSIGPNKPIFVSHYSKDKEWAFVESSFAFGWVKVSEIVLVDKKYTDIWQNAKQIFITKEDSPIYANDGTFLFYTRIGMMLPLVKENQDSYTVLTLSKYKNSQAFYNTSNISKSLANNGILNFDADNINNIINQLSMSNYGWGGIYGQRDCSSTLRDFYSVFGIWLPRNSYKQSLEGRVISLDGLSNTQKITLIKDKAVAFETLLYKKGHIVLYSGLYNNQVIIFQNVWGVKTKKDGVEGRFVVGKPLFSTLELGINLKDFDGNSSLLENLKSLNTPSE